MDQKKIDQIDISRLTEKEAKAELFSALTIIRNCVADVPEEKMRDPRNYSKEGHMKCVNYLRGFTNIWRRNYGS